MRRPNDTMPKPPKAPKAEPFNVKKGRVPILDHRKVLRGHAGSKMSEAGLVHFGLKHGGKLQRVQGRQCWVANGPTLATVSAEGTNPAMPKPTIGGKP